MSDLIKFPYRLTWDYTIIDGNGGWNPFQPELRVAASMVLAYVGTVRLHQCCQLSQLLQRCYVTRCFASGAK